MIATVGSRRRLNRALNRPIFGLRRYDPEKSVNVASASKIFQDAEKFRVRVIEDGNFEVMAMKQDSPESATFQTCWRRGVMMFDHSQIQYLDHN